jgi:hypothetical protein
MPLMSSRAIRFRVDNWQLDMDLAGNVQFLKLGSETPDVSNAKKWMFGCCPHLEIDEPLKLLLTIC